MTSNNPPVLSFEMDQADAEWLAREIAIRIAEDDKAFSEINSMSSSDPRSVHRAILSMKLAGNLSRLETMKDRMLAQSPELSTVFDRVKRITDPA